jgi:prepilin-type N-terminal cleavage/methylation domain-containing protein
MNLNTMKQYPTLQKHRKQPRGFTLVETVIAMGIIAVMITAFLAAFAPAVTSIRKSISSKDVNRLASTLEYEM